MILASVAKALLARTEIIQREELLQRLESSIHALQDEKEDAAAGSSSHDEIHLGNGIKVNFDRRLVWNDQMQINLTSAESKLLRILFENPTQVFTHQELVSRVQGYQTNREEAPQVLRPLVSRLRHKIARFAGSEKWIVSVRGKGYGLGLDALRQG
jgi:DNA-binding response OmpR family regulator